LRDLTVISHMPDYYHGWPTLSRRKNGELLLVYSGGRRAHVCPFGRVELMRSHDSGKTWTPPTILINSPIDDRDAGILETRQGSILATTFTSLDYTNHLPEDHKERNLWANAYQRITRQQQRALLGVWMIRSTDGGGCWSAPYDCLVNSPHGPIQIYDGRLLYVGKSRWKKEHIGACHSIDDGQTWQWLSSIPTRPGDDQVDYHELHAVEASSGRIVIHIRNHNQNNLAETLQSESTDGGKTWSSPHEIGVWGLPSHLLRLQDNRLLMSYGHRRPPRGNLVRLSDDDGDSWSAPITISDDGTYDDLGYPSTVQVDNGTLITVWYERMSNSPMAVLRQCTWMLPG